MDEEGGRPGPRGLQFGHADVLRDVLAESLCSKPQKYSQTDLTSIFIDSRARRCGTAMAQVRPRPQVIGESR
jgi:hypothetical protein